MECNCDMRTKLVGDGCEACNPALALEHANATIADQAEEIKRLRTALLSIAEGYLGDERWQANYDRIRAVAVAALAEKNGLTPNAGSEVLYWKCPHCGSEVPGDHADLHECGP